MITYSDNLDRITTDHLHGFFDGWKNPPNVETFLKILKQSDYIVLAVDVESSNVVGFVTAISDGVLSAYIPLLEVLPDYKKQGIGSELMKQMMKQLDGLYMIDLVCDKELNDYYKRFGFESYNACMVRNFNNQSGK